MSFLLTSSKGTQYTFQESELLGQGAFGKVFKGFDRKKQQRVAIKRVSNTVLDRYGEEFIRCLGNEANILQEMVNEHTVAVVDYFQTSNYLNIIMEYCEGGNLGDLLNSKRRFTEQEAVNYLCEIVGGLYAIHKSGHMHRDFKLENILLKDGHCKIGDFRFTTKQQKADQYVETQENMAPEIFCCGFGNFYDKQVDIWALGIMFHEMLFGDRPYERLEAQMRNIIHNSPYRAPSSPVISRESRDLLQRMLKFDPVERITVEDIRRHPLLKSKMNGSGTLEDLGISAEFKKSLRDSMIHRNVDNIFTKLDQYKKCCAFLLFIMKAFKPYMGLEKGFILDDLHGFSYYLLKFAHNKLSVLYRYLEKGECPEKLLKPVETKYWKNFLESEKFAALKSHTKKYMELIEKIFVLFRDELGFYLQRAGKNTKELDTIYNDNIHADCTAVFTGKLLEAINLLQRLSQTKKDAMWYEISNVLMDLGFGRIVVDYMDNCEVDIDTEGYKIQRDRMGGNICDFIRLR